MSNVKRVGIRVPVQIECSGLFSSTTLGFPNLSPEFREYSISSFMAQARSFIS